MNVVYDEEYVAVEVEFEDGHSMNVDIIPAVQIRPQFQHVSTGDARIHSQLQIPNLRGWWIED